MAAGPIVKFWMYAIAVASVPAAFTANASGQVRPIVGRGVTAFDPEISVVNSGAVLDAQAVVSHDRRYVTITMAPQNSRLIALRPFPVQGVAGNGNVGGANVGGGNAPGDGDRPTGGLDGAGNDADGAGGGYNAAAFPLRVRPTEQELLDPQILNARGMIRLTQD
jgi:hypothetical protein